MYKDIHLTICIYILYFQFLKGKENKRVGVCKKRNKSCDGLGMSQILFMQLTLGYGSYNVIITSMYSIKMEFCTSHLKHPALKNLMCLAPYFTVFLEGTTSLQLHHSSLLLYDSTIIKAKSAVSTLPLILQDFQITYKSHLYQIISPSIQILSLILLCHTDSSTNKKMFWLHPCASDLYAICMKIW